MKQQIDFEDGYSILVFDPEIDQITVKPVHTIPTGLELMHMVGKSDDEYDMGMQLYKYFQVREKEKLSALEATKCCFLLISESKFTKTKNEARNDIHDALITNHGADYVISLRPTFLRCPKEASTMENYVITNAAAQEAQVIDSNGRMVKVKSVDKFVIETPVEGKSIEVIMIKRDILKDFAYES